MTFSGFFLLIKKKNYYFSRFFASWRVRTFVVNKHFISYGAFSSTPSNIQEVNYGYFCVIFFGYNYVCSYIGARVWVCVCMSTLIIYISVLLIGHCPQKKRKEYYHAFFFFTHIRFLGQPGAPNIFWKLVSSEFQL